MKLDVRDAGVELRNDPARVVADLFLPGESTPGAVSRTEQVVERVLALSGAELGSGARAVETGFRERHDGLDALVHANAAKVHRDADRLDERTRLVLGATFTAEYAIEGIAVCNPSAVVAPDQSGTDPGQARVVVALRSIGEGHVSAISFCCALVGPGREWRFEHRALPLCRPEAADGGWDLDHFQRSLERDGQLTEVAHAVIQKLPSRLRAADIESAVQQLPPEFFSHYESRARVEAIRMVGRSAYEAEFPPESALSQRVLLPRADEERHGMEDARFVRFTDDDGSVDYRASYTAYDGHAIASRLIVTTDFRDFSVHRLAGAPAGTKGMAFFPRRIGGRLLALGRSDGESITLATSDDGLAWDDDSVVYRPELLWEVVQSGNCGSPIETDRGWLVLTHGVGPMRRYSIGAILLDLENPSRVIARLESPLLEPSPGSRDGYVPNVVYSCGGMVHDGMLWLPYGVDDERVRVVSVPVEELLGAMSAMPTPAPARPPRAAL